MEFLLGLFIGVVIGAWLGKSQKPDSGKLHVTSATEVVDKNVTVARTKGQKNLDNASVLLYFGAFLMIAGVGLFVGLSEYSGGVKTFTVLAMALTFYVAGIVLHTRAPRLRLAAVTLAAIGLVCLPLTGAAAYVYVADMANGPTIWFVTSALSLVLYVFALWRIRQSLIGYMSVFMCLSLWLSGVAIIEAPIHFFGWAMIVLGMIYLLATRYFALWRKVEQPLSVSASIIVPVALVMMFALGWDRIQAIEHGVSALLASVFYVLALWFERKADVRQTYFALAFLLVPLAVLLIVWGMTDSWVEAAFAVAMMATLQLVASFAWKKLLVYREVALTLGALVLGVSVVVATFETDWNALATLMSLNLVVHLVAAIWARSQIHLLFGLVVMLLLPIVIGFFVYDPNLEVQLISAIYLALAAVIMLAGHVLRYLGYRQALIAGYSVALGAAWFVSLSGAEAEGIMWTSIAISVFAVIAAYYERLVTALVFAVLLAFVAAWTSLLANDNLRLENLTVLFTPIALLCYLVGKVHALAGRSLQEFARAWSLLGVGAVYAAAIIPVIAWAGSTAPSWNAGVFMLAGALTCYEAYRVRSRRFMYYGAAALLAGLQWLLYNQDVREVQLYTHMWAAYFGVLAWVAHKDKQADAKQTSTILALSVLTLPLAWEALEGNTGWGLLLLFESVAILLVGLWLRYRLVSWWGLAVGVASVLYQLREFQFFVLLLLGAGVIGVGVYVLLKQEKKS